VLDFNPSVLDFNPSVLDFNPGSNPCSLSAHLEALLVELHPTAEVACGVAPRIKTQNCLIIMVKLKQGAFIK